MVYKLEEHPRRTQQMSSPRRSTVERRVGKSSASRVRATSEIRNLLGHRGEAIAMALADRVPARAVASAAEIAVAEANRLGRAYTDFDFTGIPHEDHLLRLRTIAIALRRANDEKRCAERQLGADIVEAVRSGQVDIFRVAAVASITPERARLFMRAAGRQGRQQKFSSPEAP